MNDHKRHILVDTTTLLLTVHVELADVADRDGAKPLLTPFGNRFPRLADLWADVGSRGPVTQWVSETLGWRVDIVRMPRRWVRPPAAQDPPPMPMGFQVLPRRWVGERTFAWLGRYGPWSKDYELPTTTKEAWISLGMNHLMLARLARTLSDALFKMFLKRYGAITLERRRLSAP